ncbi:hypothetical protein PAXRUDRAFT_833470 [Paxillus rubicundulus Ve08.2h10]|uniref:Protein-S-isoprenylcysteine O-methyltransferase n=1 Tax=Paxillus rubicundulus Ve08.2h10 TaxID=930991 RepID=A0A0D0CY58_9AGAM|nr:hypothetical protein PAXRUDRAFT_833470 [Paxillus rubicundulus Ve08.2h10]
MHIVGLDIPMSISHGIEAMVVLTITSGSVYSITKMRSVAANAEAKGGRIRTASMPTSFLARIVTPIQVLATFIPPLGYVCTVVLNGFQQPEWMAKFALSEELVGSQWKNALRVLACSASFLLRGVVDYVLHHLGEQWDAAGRREKSRIVQTGPYAFVRHPLFSLSFIQGVLWIVMFWSYVPLFSLAIIATVFVIKLPIEENTILQDERVREEYRAYMKKVPARLIPYIW